MHHQIEGKQMSARSASVIGRALRVSGCDLRRRLSAGFTLVEVMFASAIMALALITMVATFVQCKRCTSRLNKHLGLMHQMRRVMEELHSHSFGDSVFDLGSHTISNGYYVVSDGPWGTKDINMTMYWADSLSSPTNVWITMSTSISSGLHK